MVLFSRFPQTFYYRLMLQRRQCLQPGLEAQLFKAFLQFGIQHYPAVQLRAGAAGSRVREVGLCQVTHINGFHLFIYNFTIYNVQFKAAQWQLQKKLPVSSGLATYG